MRALQVSGDSELAMSNSDHWKSGLQRVGTYYEGYIDDFDLVFEDYRRDTVTSWGTRRSSSVIKTPAVEDKENKSPFLNNELVTACQCAYLCYMHKLILG